MNRASNVVTRLAEGQHSFKIELVDFWGNNAEITGTLEKDHSIGDRLIRDYSQTNQNSEIDLLSF